MLHEPDMQVVLGLGSNVGSRAAMLNAACKKLEHLLGNMQRSTVMETPALLPENAPDAWNMPFLNMAVMGQTTLQGLALLAEIKAIEQQLGREARGRWGPREIDIDILVYGEEEMESGLLIIPHTELANRPFALKPLVQLWPEWRFPKGVYAGKTAQQVSEGLGY